MITVGMNYLVKPDKQEVFERAFAQVLESLQAAPGHHESKLYREVKNTFSYLIISEWTDETAFQEFIRSEAFRRVTNWGSEQILEGRPKHQVFGSNH